MGAVKPFKGNCAISGNVPSSVALLKLLYLKHVTHALIFQWYVEAPQNIGNIPIPTNHTYMSLTNSINIRLNSSHTVAYNQNARRAYKKSQHAEDFGRIKINLFL